MDSQCQAYISKSFLACDNVLIRKPSPVTSRQDQEYMTRSALVLYGTETGNAQDVAYEISQCLERLHIATTTREFDATPLQSLLSYNLVVIAISTTGQGDFPSNAHRFWLGLRRKKLTATSLANVKYGLVGLCDSSYPKFNLTARKLHKRLQQLGASSILEPCEADEQGEEGTEGAFLTWMPQFQDAVLECLPLPVELQRIPSNQRLASQWTLAKASTNHAPPGEVAMNGNGIAVPKTSAYSPVSTFWVTLEANDRVTPADHWQDVRAIRLRADRAASYLPGDALAIRPENLPNDVEKLIKLLGWQSVADDIVELRNHRALHSDDVLDPVFADKKSFTLRELLTCYLDINSIPRRSFFSKIAHFTNDDMQKERALEFTDPQYLDEYFDYATRPRRSILEVLQEFDTLKIPWEEAINVFPVLRPRQFSVASGGTLKQDGMVLELLVAIVKYRTVIKRIREGVCTRYLAKLPTGSRLNVALHTEGRFHNTLSELDRPHLLIGGGTGVAPLRSIIFEKAQMNAQMPNSFLIFGCRNAQSDYFYQDEWLHMQNDVDPRLRVITAFSRDQANKVYIQDRIRENSELIREYLQDSRSMIVVCGSSGAMPKAVRQALQDILGSEHPKADQDEMRDIITHLEKTGRYKQETW